jgi:DNA-binding winged helix-turn-helix (wHTH) protein/tetratricopeptide (TPR) repeat protein
LRFGIFELDLQTGELRKSGVLLRLPPQPFKVLALLASRPSQLVTREELRDQIWGKDTFVDFEHGLNFAIKKIRDTLGDDAERPRYVETLPRRGYRFIAPVDFVAPSSEKQEQGVIRTAESRQEAAPRAGAAPKPSRLRWPVISAATALVIGLAVVGWRLYVRNVTALSQKDKIVLADFENSTGDRVFDDALKQALAAELQQSPFLNILSDRQVGETLKLMGRSPDQRLDAKTALELCQRTGSKAVLAGSIAPLGSHFVINLNAMDCLSGDSLARQEAEAARKEEVLKGLDGAATKLRTKLGESLRSIEKYDLPIEQVTTGSLEALQAFTLGKITLDAKGDFHGAVPFFQRAIRIDPDFAAAYGGLAAAYADIGESSLARKNIENAYSLRERLSEREKLRIEAGYYSDVTGELEKALQVCELSEQAYPRESDAHFTAGNIDSLLGRFEEGLVEAKESFRLNPRDGLNNAYLVYAYMAANQMEQAQKTAQEAQARNLDSPSLHLTLYPLAFALNDSAAMAREVAWAAGRPGVEDVMNADQANTAAYHGQLAEARQFSRQAIESAERAGEQETAASYQADAALREGLFSNAAQARRWAAAALAGSPDKTVQFAAALAIATSGDTARAQALAAGLEKRFRQDTIANLNFLPTLRAQISIRQGNPSQAIDDLRPAAPYELGQIGGGGFGVALYPVYVRGEAYLAARRGPEAAVEFQKILDHRSVVIFESIGALAHLGLGRAYAMQGDTTKARAAYQDFLTLWKDADPDIPILKQAKSEYAKLQ